MGNNDGKVIIQVDTNAMKAAQDFKQLDNEIKNLNRDAQQTKTQTNNVSSGFSGASSALFSLKGAAIAAAGAFAAMKLTQFAGDIFKISSQFEQLNVAFEVLAGKTAGAQLVKDLTDLANVTPMTTQGLADNARLLLSFGEASQNVISDLKLLGDISGGNQEKMDSLTLAFAQAGASGRLMGQDLLQMVNAGFNPLQIISEKTGKSMAQLKKEMEQGKIGFDQIKQAMADATSEGGRFYQMMEKQSETLSGKLLTLSDKWGQVAKNIGDLFLPTAKAAVGAFIWLGDKVLILQKRLAELDHPVQRAVIGLQKLVGILPKDSGLVFSMKTDVPEKANQAHKAIQNLNTGFRSSASAISSATSSHKSHSIAVTQTKDAYQLLQDKVSTLKNNLLVMATQGKNSGDVWAKALAKYTAEAKKLDTVNKSLEQSTQAVAQVTSQEVGAYDQLNNKISEMKNKLENMAASGQGGTPVFNSLKNDFAKATNEMQKINTQVTNSMGLDWSNIKNSISSDLASAFTTPLREGETAFQRLGNVAMNTISSIAQALATKLVFNPLVESVSGSGIGKSISGFFGGLFKSANGNVFQNGNPVKAFASGGVVSRPTLFPMANGGTGLMGEAGAEAIMPLRRGSNGKLGVEATGASPNINIYNQSQSQIETVKRPNGEMDIFIRRVNAAITSDKGKSSFAQANAMQQTRGVTAA